MKFQEVLDNKTPVVFQLVGNDGNAFALMAVFSKAAKQDGWTKVEINAVMNECMSGDYDHLLRTLMKVQA